MTANKPIEKEKGDGFIFERQRKAAGVRGNERVQAADWVQMGADFPVAAGGAVVKGKGRIV